MIIVKFHGRLGNQIFLYVFAMSMSKKFNTFFIIDNSENIVFFKYFKKITIHFDFLNIALLKLYRNLIKNRVSQVGIENVAEMKKLLTNNCYYDGFFQSENYFEISREYLKNNLIIRKKYINAFKNKYGQLFLDNKIIAIHCRLGDYLNWGSEELGGENLTLPQSYYQNAISQIDEIEKYQFIVVTDDIFNIENRFDFIENKIIVSEEEIIDFQILQNAHQLIVSNSSFSWWAAYLNNKTAPVYVPEYWLGFKVEREFPVGIISENFIKIPVY